MRGEWTRLDKGHQTTNREHRLQRATLSSSIRDGRPPYPLSKGTRLRVVPEVCGGVVFHIFFTTPSGATPRPKRRREKRRNFGKIQKNWKKNRSKLRNFECALKWVTGALPDTQEHCTHLQRTVDNNEGFSARHSAIWHGQGEWFTRKNCVCARDYFCGAQTFFVFFHFWHNFFTEGSQKCLKVV